VWFAAGGLEAREQYKEAGNAWPSPFEFGKMAAAQRAPPGERFHGPVSAQVWMKNSLAPSPGGFGETSQRAAHPHFL